MSANPCDIVHNTIDSLFRKMFSANNIVNNVRDRVSDLFERAGGMLDDQIPDVPDMDIGQSAFEELMNRCSQLSSALGGPDINQFKSSAIYDAQQIITNSAGSKLSMIDKQINNIQRKFQDEEIADSLDRLNAYITCAEAFCDFPQNLLEEYQGMTGSSGSLSDMVGDFESNMQLDSEGNPMVADSGIINSVDSFNSAVESIESLHI